MVDTHRFFNHNNIAHFSPSDRSILAFFYHQPQTIFFLQKRLDTLSEKNTNRERNKEGTVALQTHFYSFASVAFILNTALFKISLHIIHKIT